MCGAVDCQRHGGRGWAQKPRNAGAYGASYQEQRKRVFRRAGGLCEACGLPGTPWDPLECDHIVSVADGGGDDLANLRAIHRSEHRRRSGQQGANAAQRANRPKEKG
jgi:5-methylcytosine-specific restriction endonuclease McrA